MVDNNVKNGANYYRLRSVSTDGKYVLSNVQLVNFDGMISSSIKIFPNPVRNMLTVSGAVPGSNITLLDIAGKTMKQLTVGGSGVDQAETNRLLPGTYLLKVTTPGGNITTIKMDK